MRERLVMMLMVLDKGSGGGARMKIILVLGEGDSGVKPGIRRP